jgi:transcription antitermination factor NusG
LTEQKTVRRLDVSGDRPEQRPSAHSDGLCMLFCDWLALQVWTGRERSSAAHLSMRGYDIFLPCVREHRFYNRREPIERALFSGYLFCRSTSSVAGKMVTSPGVIQIVGPVCTAEVEAIRRAIATGHNLEPWPAAQVGDRLCLEDGPLRGVEGIVVRIENGHRLILSVTALHRSVAVDIDSEWVKVSRPLRPRTAPTI